VTVTKVASVNLATAKKYGCAKNGPNTDHTWEIWLRPLTWLPSKKMVVQRPMVALLATNKYGCAKTNDVEYIQHSFSFASQEYDVARCITSHGCVNGISNYHNTVPPTLNIVAHGIPLTIFNVNFI
jgi:hypothetical protein